MAPVTNKRVLDPPAHSIRTLAGAANRIKQGVVWNRTAPPGIRCRARLVARIKEPCSGDRLGDEATAAMGASIISRGVFPLTGFAEENQYLAS